MRLLARSRTRIVSSARPPRSAGRADDRVAGHRRASIGLDPYVEDRVSLAAPASTVMTIVVGAARQVAAGSEVALAVTSIP